MDYFVSRKIHPKMWKRSDCAEWFSLEDIEGDTVLLPESFPNILLDKKDGSERLIPLIKDLVHDPYEIWVQFMKNDKTGQTVTIQLYISIYKAENKDKSVLILKCDRMEGDWVASDFFEVTPKQGDFFRAGILQYGKSEEYKKAAEKFGVDEWR